MQTHLSFHFHFRYFNYVIVTPRSSTKIKFQNPTRKGPRFPIMGGYSFPMCIASLHARVPLMHVATWHARQSAMPCSHSKPATDDHVPPAHGHHAYGHIDYFTMKNILCMSVIWHLSFDFCFLSSFILEFFIFFCLNFKLR